MKLTTGSLVVFAIVIAIVDASITDATEVTTTDEQVTLSSSSEERRWTPSFPKIGQKFNLTTKQTTMRIYSTPIRSKNPVLNVVPKAVQMKSKNYWKTATTRRPLMKHAKFTVNPLSSFKIVAKSEKQLGSNNEFDRKYNNLFRKIMNDDEKEKESSEEDSDTVRKEHKNKIKHIKSWSSQFRKVQSKIAKEMKNISKQNDNKVNNHLDVTTDKIKPRISELSSEEKEDRKEFIFVTPKSTKDKEHIKEHSVVDADSDESDETTTTIEKELKLRQTRSINIIEEENLATTISGFKFTGKVASLSNDLVFKNINV